MGTKTWKNMTPAALGFPNTHFDPQKAHVLYNQYHEQYVLADEVGFDGIMTNEHHSSYWCMKPAVNLDAAVIAKLTSRVKIAILGNVIAVNDPIRMAEEIAMLDCFSGGRNHLRLRPGEPPWKLFNLGSTPRRTAPDSKRPTT